jgi:hypothetical protein
MLQGIVVQKY